MHVFLYWKYLVSLKCLFSDTFAKLRKATISGVVSVLSVCPSVCLPVSMGQLGFHWTDFHEILYWRGFVKSVYTIQVLFKLLQEWRVLYLNTYVHFLSCFAEFVLGWQTFQTKLVEKIKTLIVCSVIVFPENHSVYEVTWKSVVEPDTP
jgi:hypothetical protein